jgi:hypothetical protein
MCANPKVVFISGKNNLSNIVALWKNAVATTVLGIFTSNASLAVIRCLLSTAAVAVLFTSAAECQTSSQANQQQVNQRSGRLSSLRHDCRPPITERPREGLSPL